MVNASSWSRGGGTGLPETCGDGIKESSRLATIDRWQGRVGGFRRDSEVAGRLNMTCSSFG